MSRKPPSDTFTRFTATSPHASQKPTPGSFSFTQPSSQPSKPSPSSMSFNAPSSDGETPAQKVARLRAAARATKANASLSPLDRAIDRGRLWADFAHRFSTYALLGMTGVAAVTAVYGLTSLVTHNRRQKRAWIEREMDRLGEAQQAFLRGEADAEQLHLLEQERAWGEMQDKSKREKQRKKEESVWTKVKGLVGAGASAGEMGDESAEEAQKRELRRTMSREKVMEQAWVDGEVKPVEVAYAPAAVAQSGIKGVGVDEKGRPVPIGKMQRVVQDFKQERRTGEDEVVARTGITGGPLDILAGNVASVVAPQSGGSSKDWLSWLRSSKS